MSSERDEVPSFYVSLTSIILILGFDPSSILLLFAESLIKKGFSLLSKTLCIHFLDSISKELPDTIYFKFFSFLRCDTLRKIPILVKNIARRRFDSEETKRSQRVQL